MLWTDADIDCPNTLLCITMSACCITGQPEKPFPSWLSVSGLYTQYSYRKMEQEGGSLPEFALPAVKHSKPEHHSNRPTCC